MLICALRRQREVHDFRVYENEVILIDHGCIMIERNLVQDSQSIILNQSSRWLWVGVLAAFCAFSPISAMGEEVYHRYWGDVHGHTIFSDGKGTVAEYFQYARVQAKLDFVMVTDHDFGHEAPWCMPRVHWQETQAAADACTDPGRFVGIAGYEWTSQSKYWSGEATEPSERLFPGSPHYYNHKNVYFLRPVDYLFSAKDVATMTPDLLAAAVQQAGGLIQNNHPSADAEGWDQFDYAQKWSSVIANTEMLADTLRYEGKTYPVRGEQTVRAFLNRGGRTGFVAGSDTHEGKPAARTAVLATALTRDAVFEALRHRRTYAVSHARIGLDFKINGHWMGEEVTVDGMPRLTVAVHGTAKLAEVAVIRDGVVCHQVLPEGKEAQFNWQDDTFSGSGYYYVRVTQADADEHGNPSYAWSSPIWVKSR